MMCPLIDKSIRKQVLRDLLCGGKIRAVLATSGTAPVGWCTYGPGADFPELQHLFPLEDSELREVWTIPCFYVGAEWRGQGVGTRLAERALQDMAQEGVKRIEAYAVKPSAAEKEKIDWRFTGSARMFERLGFCLKSTSHPFLAAYERLV